jgi:nucleotide-binding universal stress UspA family protein
MPEVDCRYINGWIRGSLQREWERAETIVQVADAMDAHMIVLTTDDPDRFLDGLRGTTSERVLRKAHCAVAVVPVEPAQKSLY